MATLQNPIAVTCIIGAKENFVGETFRAVLRFKNQAQYTVERLAFTVDILTPSQRPSPVSRTTAASLAPGEQKDVPVEYRLAEAGNHGLRVRVGYSDFTNDQKQFMPPLATIAVPRALDETARKVHRLPLAPEAEGGARTYTVSVAAQCRAVGGLRLQQMRFVPKDASVVLVRPPSCPEVTLAHYDSLRCVAEVQVAARVAVPQAPPGATFFSASAASYGATQELGHFEWDWVRGDNNAIAGTDSSSVVRTTKPSDSGDVTLEVLSVFPPRPAVGDGVTLTLRAMNTHPTERREASVAVHVTKLLPHFLYTGPVLRPIGVLPPNGGAVDMQVHLVAHYPGPATIAGGIELRETSKPEKLLWPVFATGAVGQTTRSTADGSQRDTLTGAGPSPLVVPGGSVWPPPLADLFIQLGGAPDA